MVKGFFRRGGASWGERIASMRQMLEQVVAVQEQTGRQKIRSCGRGKLWSGRMRRDLRKWKLAIRREIQQIVATALQSKGSAL